MSNTELLLLDGDCGLCNRLALFLKPRLQQPGSLQFLGQQSEQGATLMAQLPEPVREIDTVVLIGGGRTLIRSAAILHAAGHLHWYWALWAQLARLVPRPLRDAVYDLVARHRRRFFDPPDRCAF